MEGVGSVKRRKTLRKDRAAVTGSDWLERGSGRKAKNMTKDKMLASDNIS